MRLDIHNLSTLRRIFVYLHTELSYALYTQHRRLHNSVVLHADESNLQPNGFVL